MLTQSAAPVRVRVGGWVLRLTAHSAQHAGCRQKGISRESLSRALECGLHLKDCGTLRDVGAGVHATCNGEPSRAVPAWCHGGWGGEGDEADAA